MSESIELLLILFGASMIFEILLILASQSRAELINYLEEQGAISEEKAIPYSPEIRNRFFLALMYPRSTKFLVFTEDDHIYLGGEHIGEMQRKIHGTLLFGLFTLITSIVLFTVLLSLELVTIFS